MSSQLKILKGENIVFNNSGDSIEELLLIASPLFEKIDGYVIELTYINIEVAKFIKSFEVSNIIKCENISNEALKLLQKNKVYVIFDNKVDDESIKVENKDFKRALNLPISEVSIIFGKI